MNSLPTTIVILIFLFIFCSGGVRVHVLSLRTLPIDPCNPTAQQDPRTLISDQLTVLINGYSESRIPLLQSIVTTYAASSLVSSILVLWGNPSTLSQTLSQLARNLTDSSFGFSGISVIRQASDSLNNRFLPRPEIKTRAVLVCDDDVEVDPKSFEFAFRMWGSNPDRLVGFFVRSHDIDLSRKEWIYTIHPDKYSIMLTKFMLLKSQYLYRYSCAGRVMASMRKIVDKAQNCEDLLMNFVVADEVNAGPILVGAKRVRDWGDARNDHDDGDGDARRGLTGEVAQVGLSSRKTKHRTRRGECISEFHRVLGRMPLRFSYGKVVNSVGEQGLCQKGLKLYDGAPWTHFSIDGLSREGAPAGKVMLPQHSSVFLFTRLKGQVVFLEEFSLPTPPLMDDQAGAINKALAVQR